MMADSGNSDEIKEAKIQREVVSKWVSQLSESGIIGLHDDDSMYIAFASRLKREVDTGPIDQLSIYWNEDELPPILSIQQIDKKRKLVISVDSNRIPERIRSIQEKSEIWIRKFRYIAWSIVLLSSLSFIAEVMSGIRFPNYTAVPRFIVFIISLFLYSLVGRVHLHGVAIGTPISVYGCSDCGEVVIKKQAIGEEGFLNCKDCGGDMVPLMEGTPSSLSTQSEAFERMLHEELKKLNKSRSG